MSGPSRSWLRQPSLVWALIAAAIAVSGGVWVRFGILAIGEWRRGAAEMAAQRAESAVDLVVTALRRDMRGVSSSVLAAPWRNELLANPTSELHDVASALARYPYPELFFASGRGAGPESMLFYARSGRTPSWMGSTAGSDAFPIIVAQDTATATRLLRRIDHDIDRRQSFSAFDIVIDETPYQAVAVPVYVDGYHDRVDSILGFLVNLSWVREHYLQDVLSQVQRLADPQGGLAFEVIDSHANTILRTGHSLSNQPTRQQTFPVLFFEPSLISGRPPKDLKREDWVVRATVIADPSLNAANAGARRAVGISAVAAFAIAAALFFGIRAARAQARLATMRSDLASAVTHELKTPLATIQLITERLATRHYGSPERSRHYALMALQETKHLRRLIDNLLAYARITDVTEAYSFEPIAIQTIIDDSLQEFRAQLEQFDVHVDVAPGLPPAFADRTAAHLMLSNVIENAVRYSTDTRYLGIHAHMNEDNVMIEVEDHGLGIPEGDLPHVTRRFFRGRDARPGGSGLGLSIVHRIVEDHRGSLTIRSTVGAGTTVSISLPSNRRVA